MLVLFGIKHSGKSSQGSRIASILGSAFFDLDQVILDQHKEYADIRSLYREKGRDYFSLAERNALETVFTKKPSGTGQYPAEPKFSIVLATGGGAMENSKLISLIDEYPCFKLFIDAPEEVLWERIVLGGIPPFLDKNNPRRAFGELYQRRRNRGIEICDSVVYSDHLNQEELGEIILSEIHSW